MGCAESKPVAAPPIEAPIEVPPPHAPTPVPRQGGTTRVSPRPPSPTIGDTRSSSYHLANNPAQARILPAIEQPPAGAVEAAAPAAAAAADADDADADAAPKRRSSQVVR